MKTKTIALAGNPNCGKTSLFNALTGACQYVGNWPGVTVERKSGFLKGRDDVEIQDLPGIYSLSPYTPEEVVSRDYLLADSPSLIINVVDASNLERNLYLTTQLLELGLPVLVALNMMDIVDKRGDSIDLPALQKVLNCPVVAVSALKGIGIEQLTQKALQMATSPVAARPPAFSPELERSLEAIASLLSCRQELKRWYAVKLFERDEKAAVNLYLPPAGEEKIREIIARAEEREDDDSESIVTGERYAAIDSIVACCLKRGKRRSLSGSDKIDRVLTNRWLGLPIFFLVMWAVYYIAIQTVGDWGTAWANDNFFGSIVPSWIEGFLGETPAPAETVLTMSAFFGLFATIPLFLRRLHDLNLQGAWLWLLAAPLILEYVCPHFPAPIHGILMGGLLIVNAVILLACLLWPGVKNANAYGAPPSALPFARRLSRAFSLQGRAGRADFWALYPLLSLAGFGFGLLGTAGLRCDAWLIDLVQNGFVAGVGAVLGFLPQMCVLFLLLAILEDCGYMARVAFIMDRIFRKFGLSGKSFIPMLVSMGCGVPGIMATRTIENEKDRRMTIMLTTFIPCGAKTPIIALIALAFFPNCSWMAAGAFFMGLAAVIVSGTLLKKCSLFAGEPAPFVMELPSYHAPSMANVNMRAMERCRSFVQKAGTVIFCAGALVWFLSSFTWSLNKLEEEHMDHSMLAGIGNALAPAFAPLGWGEWKPAVASVTGLIAKENVVGTFGILYRNGDDAGNEQKAADGEEPAEPEKEPAAILSKLNAGNALALALNLGGEKARLLAPEQAETIENEEEAAEEAAVAPVLASAGAFTPLTAFTFMIFNLLCAPCFAAMGAIRREMNSAKWTWFAIGYMCAWAYVISLLVYQYGIWMTTGAFGPGQIVALLLTAFGGWLLLRRPAGERPAKMAVRASMPRDAAAEISHSK